jgi:hypothetical protein
MPNTESPATFTPRGTITVHTDWDAPLGGFRAGRVIVHAIRYGVAGEPKKTFRGTEAEAIDWTFRVMAAAGENGFAVELRDARG